MKIVDPSTGREEPTSSWVRVGDEYSVIGISASPGRSIDVQILTDDGAPSYWSVEMFETVSNLIPSNWAVRIRPGGITELTAEAWSRPGFWEGYFDSVPEAVAVYERELAVMLAEDPTPEQDAANSATIPVSEKLVVSWPAQGGTQERPGISVYGLTARPGWIGGEFPIRLWPAATEVRSSRLSGPAWEVVMWDVALCECPRGISWSEALRGTLEFFIDGGCRISWLGDGVNFCDPPDLFAPEHMSGGILAALTSEGEFVGSVNPDAPVSPLTDEPMSWLRHYARGLADVE